MTSDRPRDTTPSITVALFDSPLLRSLQSRRVFPLSKLTRNPQYVSARTFARALVDLLAPVEPGGPTGAQARLARIEAKVEELPPHLALRRQLLAMLDRADGDVNRRIEAVVAEHGGHKSLYSDSYYDPDEFWTLYGGEDYHAAKKRYDPRSRLLDLYAKAVNRR